MISPRQSFFGPSAIAVATTSPLELVDVTDELEKIAAESGLAAGVMHVYCPHTSCGLAITELEAGLHEDIAALLERLAPVEGQYAHDDMERRWQNLEPDERRNGWSHLRAVLATQPALIVPLARGGLALGQWQRAFLVELDGPRAQRTLTVHAWGALDES